MDNLEYRIIDKQIDEAQKCLNQWRHEYLLKILSMTAYVYENFTHVTILLTRERKG